MNIIKNMFYILSAFLSVYVMYIVLVETINIELTVREYQVQQYQRNY